MRNVEFKAELRDMQIARAVARSIKAQRVDLITQEDTYYRVFNGRLKKRVASTEAGTEPVEYIRYEREDRLTPKVSSFQIMSEDEFRERFGSEPLPEWVTVRKQREIYLAGPTRIHLDTVDTLGNFLEFESIVSPKHNVARAHEALSTLRAAFGPALGEPISGSYADLIALQTNAE